MISIGNDIVALELVDKQRTSHPNFYSKIITESENLLFTQNPISQLPFERFVWLFWSVKESVYKFLKRNDHDLIFSPTKIIIRDFKAPLIVVTENITETFEPDIKADIFYTGEVVYHAHALFFRAIIINDIIATIVSHDPYFEKIYWEIKYIASSDSQEQSHQVREFAINKLLGLHPQNIFTISKTSVGYPVIIQNENPTNIPLSFAHHGQYISYCFGVL